MALISKRAQFRMRRFWQTAGLPLSLLLILVVLVGGFLMLNNRRSKEEDAVEVAQAPAANLTMEEVLQRHAIALGGIKPLKELRTFLVTGTLELQTGKLEMSIAKRVPDSYRVQARTESGGGFVQVASGNTTWLRRGDGEWEEQERNPDDRYLGGVHSIALRAWLREVPAEMPPRDPESEDSHYIVTVPLPEGGMVRSYINPETFLEDRLEVVKDGKVNEIQYFTDHRSIRGLLIPHHVRTVYPETGEERVFHVEKTFLNSGVPSTVFSPGEQ